MEAATIGCPVITTTGHSVEEVLGGSATFIAPRNATALADAILEAFQDRPSGREPRRFDIASHIAGVVGIYAKLQRRPRKCEGE
jgi:glycosyltransferase involved in cell wall biosynthesis